MSFTEFFIYVSSLFLDFENLFDKVIPFTDFPTLSVWDIFVSLFVTGVVWCTFGDFVDSNFGEDEDYTFDDYDNDIY